MVTTPSPIQAMENILGCKWSLAILWQIQKGTRRPGVLRRALPGLSTKVMNERLKKLVRFGLLRRVLHPGLPLHVDYLLTPYGQKFCRILANLRKLR